MRRFLLAACGLTGFMPATAHALNPLVNLNHLNEWKLALCNAGNPILRCLLGFPGGAAGLSLYAYQRIISAFEVLYVGVSGIVLLIAMANMLIFSTDETHVGQGRMAFVYVMVGGAIVSLSRLIVQAFSPTTTGVLIVNNPPINTAVASVVLFIKLLLSIALLTNIAVQAARFIASQGEQDAMEKAKQRLIAGFIGVALVLLANIIVLNLNPTLAGASINNIGAEIAGISNYLITIVGFGAVVSIIIAGILLIVSVDESLRDRAKTFIKAGVISVLVCLIAYALVFSFILL